MRAIWTMTQRALCLLVAGMALLSANQSRATILGLGDGTYDVTLTCLFADCAPAGSLGPFTGTLTVAGSDVTDWSFAFPPAAIGIAETFNGDPVETIDTFGSFEIARGFGDAVAFDELALGIFFGSPKWDLFVGGVSLISGTWTAVLQDTRDVPEPSSAILILSGLAALGVYSTRVPRRRG